MWGWSATIIRTRSAFFLRMGTIDPPSRGRLFIVADGMGGHKGGKVASGLAVKTIGEVYFSDGNESVQVSLVNAIQAANEAVFSASKKDPALSGMGTTCVAMVVKGSSVYVAHIGDSRAYRVTRESIFQLTEDHTAVARDATQGHTDRGRSEESSRPFRALSCPWNKTGSGNRCATRTHRLRRRMVCVVQRRALEHGR